MVVLEQCGPYEEQHDVGDKNPSAMVQPTTDGEDFEMGIEHLVTCWPKERAQEQS